MLTQSRILNYVKINLGYPYSDIEFFDDQYIKYFNDITIRDFSMHYPNIANLQLDDDENVNMTSSRSCEIYDPEGREIIGIQNVIGGFDQFNIPVGSVPDDVMKLLVELKTQKLIGQYNVSKFAFKYNHPNILIFDGRFPSEGTAIYERVHVFESVPPKMEIHLRNLCLADAKIIIGATRKNIKTIPTQIGDIDIDASIGDEGKQEREDIMTKLKERLALTRFIEVI